MPKRKLPPPDELRHLILTERLSYSEIAERYSVHPGTVPCTVRNDARIHGYPTVASIIGTPVHRERISRGRRRLMEERGVKHPEVLRDVIRDFLRRSNDHGWTGAVLAHYSGVSMATFWEMARPNPRRRTSQAMADKVTAMMDLIDTANGYITDEHTAPVDECTACAKRNQAVVALSKTLETGEYHAPTLIDHHRRKHMREMQRVLAGTRPR